MVKHLIGYKSPDPPDPPKPPIKILKPQKWYVVILADGFASYRSTRVWEAEFKAAGHPGSRIEVRDFNTPFK